MCYTDIIKNYYVFHTKIVTFISTYKGNIDKIDTTIKLL